MDQGNDTGSPTAEKVTPAPKRREPKPTFDPKYIRDLSEQVYRILLEADCPGNVERMIAKDEDTGEKLRNRAGYYDRLTRTYLKVLGFVPPEGDALAAAGVTDDKSSNVSGEVNQ